MQEIAYFNHLEDIELYIIFLLSVFTIWFILNTLKYHRGEKRKVKHLHRFAKEGEVEAQQHLAYRYHGGYAVKKSSQIAAFWYQKAAFSGGSDARSFLDKMLRKKFLVD